MDIPVRKMGPVSREERWWDTNGPFPFDPAANAIHHLKRYTFAVDKGVITPPPGYEFSKEDRMAIDYLVKEWEFSLSPVGSDMKVKRPAQTKPAS